LKVPEKYVGIM